MSRIYKQFFGLLPIVVLLAACGGAASDPTPTPTPDPLAGADPARGQAIFESGSDVLEHPCSNCHTVDGSEKGGATASEGVAGPSLLGIATTAGERAPDLTPIEYIRQSLKEPRAVVAEGYSPMSSLPGVVLSDQDILDVTAYLLSLE
jgi:mono/diheme cytochrome c family protein